MTMPSQAELDPASVRVLVVEDDLELAELVVARLRREGFDVSHAADGASARDRILVEHPDVVVLDAMLPGLDGFGVCRAVRPTFAGGILMLTALDDDVDQVLGLELGADDYAVKPVSPRVLVARVRALARRARPPATARATLRIGPLEVDPRRREVAVDGQPVDVTTAEFDLLWYLAERAGTVVSREDLYRDLHGVRYDGIDRGVDVHVSRLRQKLGDDPRAPRFLKTVRGAGYLLTPGSA